MVGRTLGHYEILESLGKGGMGEVYRAHDPKLKRDVAIKVLPTDLAASPERRERFEREAVAVAALDHPNIVTVHSVEEADGLHFITMQLVEGTTLAEAIPRSGMTVEKYFPIAVALASAIAAAHERGITHRDLKPSNVMVTRDGVVKVLDFGLAKLAEDESVADVATEARTAFDSPDAREPLTEEGKVLGTVAYMSPEQAEGHAVDHRSDIFSLGIILYEMACGERPFGGDSKLSVMSSILKDTPTSITDVNTGLPRHLGRIVKHALEKDVRKRYQSALDLKNQLEELAAEVESGEAFPVSKMGGGGRSPVGVGLIAAAVVIIALLAGYALLGPSNGPGDVWTAVRLTDLPGREWGGSLSPDGDRFVYSGDDAGNFDIYLQFIGGGNVFNLTEDSPQADRTPAIGPDGRIAFRSDREPAGIYVMGPGGENQQLLVAGGHQPDWSSDGRIAYSTNGFTDVQNILGGTGFVKVIEVDTGATRELTEGFQPTFSPSGSRIAYMKLSGGRRDVWTVGADGSGAVALTSDDFLDWSPRWSPDGRYLYFASNRGGADNIWRIEIDGETGAALSDPEQVTSGGTDRQGFLSFSADGSRLMYTSDQLISNIEKIAFDPDAEEVVGAREAVTSGPRRIAQFDVSRDGQLAYTDRYPQEDIFVMDIDGGNRLRVTDDPARDRRPRWSPDGTRIGIYSDAGGNDYQVWTFDASGAARMRHTTGFVVWYPVWSPGGRRLAYFAPRVAGHTEPGGYIVDADKPFDQQTPVRLPLIDDGRSFFPYDWSANGRLVGHAESTNDIWLLTIANESYEDLGVRGTDPRWLSDGNRIVYTSGRGGPIRLADIRRPGDFKEILSLPPDELSIPLLSPDGETLYFLRTERRSDIYLLRRES